MKTRQISTVVVALSALFSGITHAAEPGVPRGALYEAKDLSNWSVGVAFEMTDRLADGTAAGLLEARSAYGMLNYDLGDWLTLSVGAGQTETKIAPLDSYEEGGFMWMAGARLNAWQYQIKDPSFLVSRVRFQGAASYWSHESELATVDTTWEETRISALICVEFFAHELDGARMGIPYSTALYFGPVYSTLDSDDAALEQIDELGIELELDIYLAHSFSLGYNFRSYDDFEYATHTMSAALHF